MDGPEPPQANAHHLPSFQVEMLDAFAPALNAINRPQDGAKCFYEWLSDAVVWTDEEPEEPSAELIARLRFLWHHRTRLAFGETSPFADWWARGRRLFPNWIGFSALRCDDSKAIQATYTKGAARMQRFVRRCESKNAADRAGEGA